MPELGAILGVIGLFVLRVGLPIVLLILLGLFIDRWQNRRNAEIKRMLNPNIYRIEDTEESETQNQDEFRKAA